MSQSFQNLIHIYLKQSQKDFLLVFRQLMTSLLVLKMKSEVFYMKSSNIFLRRPVTAIVISLVILLVGTLAILNMPISQYPDITPPTVQITSNFTGADAQTVEQTTTTAIETQVNGVPGIAYMQSNSANNGNSQITATLNIGADPNIVALDIQNRVGIATPTLPQQVQKLGITTLKRNPAILMLVAVYSPKHTHSVPFMDNYANIYLRDILLRTPGVGDVFSRADNFSMRVWLKTDKLAQLGLTVNDVQNAINEQNLQVAAGSVAAPPQNSGSAFEFTVFTNSRLTTEEQFGDIVIRSNPAQNSIVYLKDVARLQLGKVSYTSNSFVDGDRSSYLLVYQAPGSNALQTAENVYAELEKLKKFFPPDVDYKVPFESVTIIKVSIHEVLDTLLKALGLVALVVFLFLQNLRSTVIPILAIPVSILGTFCFFIPLGFTINTLTMFGFVLAIGIVVDDAIIVVEAVQHYIDEKGMSPKEATYHAMKDISAPVVAIALILAAVFVPVGFIPGIVGRLYQQFAITIAISVMISAFNALTLSPALAAMLLYCSFRFYLDAHRKNSVAFWMLAISLALWAALMGAGQVRHPFLEIFGQMGDFLGPVPQMLLAIAMVMVLAENQRNAVQENALAFSTLGVDPRRLLSAHELVPSMQSFLDRLVAPLPTHRAIVFISEPWRATLPAVQKGFSSAFVEKLQKSGAGDYLAELAYRRGGVVTFHRLAELEEPLPALPRGRFEAFKETLVSEGIRDLMAVSLQTREHNFGVILFPHAERRMFGSSNLRLLIGLTLQIALTLENYVVMHEAQRRTKEYELLT